ncbi:MAG: hypothetical protein JRF31_10495 [Deltaproteobacteria bacterium]|nr:hypothetical protein [Deltaproteobacteria bacterium]MBW1959433.1 hypothetical protein [Deltaproteobacteria bacterium]MBW2090204.1 hypothetical protein [Deltaproteobacteria bacterium]MBW2321244.1 hypothetical protein [Deltaproteobacteria bacterium]
MRPCDRNIKRILQLADKMIELAEIGDAEREDTGCGILYGVLLDSAYKLKRLAEEEKEKHIKKGWWKNDIE